MARLTEEDRIVIKYIHQEKGYGARKIVKEFPNKNWNVGSVSRLLRKIRQTGSHKKGKKTGRKRSARTNSNIDEVKKLVLNEDGQLKKGSLSVRQVAKMTGIARSTVRRIVKDLNLKIPKLSKCNSCLEIKKKLSTGAVKKSVASKVSATVHSKVSATVTSNVPAAVSLNVSAMENVPKILPSSINERATMLGYPENAKFRPGCIYGNVSKESCPLDLSLVEVNHHSASEMVVRETSCQSYYPSWI